MDLKKYASLESKTFVTVAELLESQKEELKLKLVAGGGGINKHIVSSDLDRPGMALSGYIERFAYKRIQILGLTEISFLHGLTPEKRRDAINNVLRFWAIPCIIVSKNLEIPKEVIALANMINTPIIHSALNTTELKARLRTFLESVFAELTVLHGTLVSVFGIGMLYIGRSGIGKSECALDLVERGHIFIADDLVLIKKFPDGELWGYANDRLMHTMEIRGIGLVDVRELFGVWRVSLRKKIDLVVNLVSWENVHKIERTGLAPQTYNLLGSELPKVVIPISPGKNLTVVSEVIAMNFMLTNIEGVNPAQIMEENLMKKLAKKAEEFDIRKE